MKPDTPILMITLQIPVNSETSVDQVLDAIGQAVSEALQNIQQQAPEPETEAPQDREEMVTQETFESYTDATNEDQLSKLGYSSTV